MEQEIEKQIDIEFNNILIDCLCPPLKDTLHISAWIQLNRDYGRYLKKLITRHINCTYLETIYLIEKMPLQHSREDRPSLNIIIDFCSPPSPSLPPSQMSMLFHWHWYQSTYLSEDETQMNRCCWIMYIENYHRWRLKNIPAPSNTL